MPRPPASPRQPWAAHTVPSGPALGAALLLPREARNPAGTRPPCPVPGGTRPWTQQVFGPIPGSLGMASFSPLALAPVCLHPRGGVVTFPRLCTWVIPVQQASWKVSTPMVSSGPILGLFTSGHSPLPPAGAPSRERGPGPHTPVSSPRPESRTGCPGSYGPWQ